MPNCSSDLHIVAARNEWEPIQVAIVAASSGTVAVTVPTFSALPSPHRIDLFRVDYATCSNFDLSSGQYTRKALLTHLQAFCSGSDQIAEWLTPINSGDTYESPPAPHPPPPLPTHGTITNITMLMATIW